MMTQIEQAERRIEAMLFACGEPLEEKKIADILELDNNTVSNLIQKIRDRYRINQSPIDIVKLDSSYQMTTLPEYSPYIQSALEVRRNSALSSAAMEVLAVVAYNQPVTRAFVEEVRGVDCSGLMKSLTEKGLIEESGRLNVPGNPIQYQTTSNFLLCFGLESLEKLPTLPESPDEGANEDAQEQLEGQIEFERD